MATEIQKLYEQRTKLVEDQRTILNKADEEKRDLTAEETGQYEQMDKDFDDLSTKIKDAEDRKRKDDERRAKLEEREEFLKTSKYEPTKPEPAVEPDGDKQKPKEKRVLRFNATPEYAEKFKQYLVGDLPQYEMKRITENPEYRVLAAQDDVKGGFLVAPEQFKADIIKDLENIMFVRRYAKTYTLPNAQTISFPELKNRISNPIWTREFAMGDEDTTMDYKKRVWTPHPLAKYIMVSKDLLRVALVDIEAEVRSGLAYEFAETEENAFLNGTGVNEPLGVMVASADGISTSRDTAGVNTSATIKADTFFDVVDMLKPQYRAGCRWIFHRNAITQVRKIKTGEGDYIWKAGLAEDAPATILGYPYDESEYMPHSFSSGAYIGLLASWKDYVIVDALDMFIQVGAELYMLQNKNVYAARKATDGNIKHENGFVRMKMGT